MWSTHERVPSKQKELDSRNTDTTETDQVRNLPPPEFFTKFTKDRPSKSKKNLRFLYRRIIVLTEEVGE